MLITNFMNALNDKFLATKISQSSANLYMRNLFILNDKKPFNSLAFLRKPLLIVDRVKEYSPNTIKTFYGSVLASLNTDKESKSYNKTYEAYLNLLTDAKKVGVLTPNEKSKKQEENWIEWDKILEKRAELEEEVKKLKNHLNEREYKILQMWFVLSLYTYLPPRRNLEYANMNVVKKWNSKLPTDKNYYDHTAKEFIFNVYKTKKVYGIDRISIADNTALVNVMNDYIFFHPVLKGKIKIDTNEPLLTGFTGKAFSAPNSITRILNGALEGRVGSSMLRHIFLSHKYGDLLEEQKDVAVAMGHSVSQQRDYIKV